MWKTACMVFALLICLTGQAEAHFGMIIPSSSTVMEKKEASLKLDISFSHPMEMQAPVPDRHGGREDRKS